MRRYLVEFFLVLVMAACSSGNIFAAHYMTLTWTPPPTSPDGANVYIFRGLSSGGESLTPINSTGIPPNTATYQDNNVSVGSTYYYTAKECFGITFSPTSVCGASTNEAHDTINGSPSDLPALAGFGALSH